MLYKVHALKAYVLFCSHAESFCSSQPRASRCRTVVNWYLCMLSNTPDALAERKVNVTHYADVEVYASLSYMANIGYVCWAY